MATEDRTDATDYETWQAEQIELQREFRASRGYRYFYFIQQFRDAFENWNDEHIELADLLHTYETDPHLILAITKRDDRAESDRLIRALDRKTLSCMASFWAVQDQIPKSLGQVASVEVAGEFEKRQSALEMAHEVVPFFKRFRNYVQHHRSAPWRVHMGWTAGSPWAGQMRLNRDVLIASKRFSGGAKRFLASQDDSSHFRPVLLEFGARWAEHVLWYDETVRQQGAQAMAEADQLRQACRAHYASYFPTPGPTTR